MTARQYLMICFFGLLASMMMPRLPESRLLLDGSPSIEIAPAAGVAEWPRYSVVRDGLLVSDVQRTNRQISFKLVMNNSLYLVHAKCNPVSEMRVDPSTRVDQEGVKEATAWACRQ